MRPTAGQIDFLKVESPHAAGPSTGKNRNSGTTGSRPRALAGIAAQGSQALASFTLQIIASRLLGVDGLGRFATLYAVIVLTTAVSSGFVGDSLTVLDRSNDLTRAGIQFWWLLLGVLAGLVCGSVSLLSGWLNPEVAIAFGCATALFVLEDALRRLLMANLRFWRIVVVDLSSLFAAVITVVVVSETYSSPGLAGLLTALAMGQLVAIGVASIVLPSADRRLVSLFPAAIALVAKYGSWRALQQCLRPALLAVVKTSCLVIGGATAAGQLEAARIYTAPTLLVVGGVSSVLFASYAAERSASGSGLLRRADRSVIKLLVAVSGFGLLAVATLPVLGSVLTGGKYEISGWAVAGWSAYAASVAAVTPYGSLAAVRGKQAAVLGIRTIDSALALVLALTVLELNLVVWVPFAMSIASLIGGLTIRQFALRERSLPGFGSKSVGIGSQRTGSHDNYLGETG